MADVIVPITGWGYSTWGTDGWDESPVVPSATGAVGSVTVAASAVVSVSGVSGTAGLGSTSVTINQSVSVTGLRLGSMWKFCWVVGVAVLGGKVLGVSL